MAAAVREWRRRGSPGTGAALRRSLATSDDAAERDVVPTMDARGWRPEPAADGVQSDGQHPFTHPHYWAPFVLVGDWRLDVG